MKVFGTKLDLLPPMDYWLQDLSLIISTTSWKRFWVQTLKGRSCLKDWYFAPPFLLLHSMFWRD